MWAALLRRVFALDVFACPRGGGRRRLVGVHPGGAPHIELSPRPTEELSPRPPTEEEAMRMEQLRIEILPEEVFQQRMEEIGRQLHEQFAREKEEGRQAQRQGERALRGQPDVAPPPPPPQLDLVDVLSGPPAGPLGAPPGGSPDTSPDSSEGW